MIRFSVFLVVSFFFISFCIGQKNTSTPTKSALNTIVIDAGHGKPDPGARGSFSVEAELTLAFALKLGEQIKKDFPDIKIIYTRTDSNLPQGLMQSNIANHARAQIANEAKGDLFISIHADSEIQKYKKIFKGYKEVTVYVKNKQGKKIKKTKKQAIYTRIRLPHTIKGSSIYIIAAHKNKDKYESIKENADIFFGEDEPSPEINSPEMLAFAALYSKYFFRKSYLFASLVNEELKQKNRPTFGVKQRSKGIWVLQATSMPSVLIETGYICTPEEEKYLNSAKGQNTIVSAIIRALKNYRTLIDKGQYNIPTSMLATATTDVPDTPETPPDIINKKDSVLPKITVKNKNVKIEIFNNIQDDNSTFNIYKDNETILENKTLSHTTAKKILLTLSPKKPIKLILNANNLKEIDSGHVALQIIDGTNENIINVFIDPNKNMILPITLP